MTLVEKVKRYGGSNVLEYTLNGVDVVSCNIKGETIVLTDREYTPYLTFSMVDGTLPDWCGVISSDGEDILDSLDNDRIKKLKGSKGALYSACVLYSLMSNGSKSHKAIKPEIVKALMNTNAWVNTNRARSAASKLYRGIKRYGGSCKNMVPLELFNISYVSGEYKKVGFGGAVRIPKINIVNTPVEPTPKVVTQTNSDSLLVNIAKGDTPFFVCGINEIKKYEGAEGVIVNRNGIFILHGDGETLFENVVFTLDEAVKKAGLDV